MFAQGLSAMGGAMLAAIASPFAVGHVVVPQSVVSNTGWRANTGSPAYAPTAITSGRTGSGTSITTASVTLEVGCLYTCAIGLLRNAETVGDPTISGWTPIVNGVNYAGGTRRVKVLAFVGDGSTGPLTIAYGGVAQTLVSYAIDAWRGVLPTVVQAKPTTGSTGTAHTVTLDADLSNAANLLVGVAFSPNFNDFTYTAEGGFAPLSLQQTAGQDGSLFTWWREGADSAPPTPSVTTSTSRTVQVAAFELAVDLAQRLQAPDAERAVATDPSSTLALALA